MPAETLNANHKDLAPLAARYVRVDERPWADTKYAGIEPKFPIWTLPWSWYTAWGRERKLFPPRNARCSPIDAFRRPDFAVRRVPLTAE